MNLYSVMGVSDRVTAREWFGVSFGRPADEVIGNELYGKSVRTHGSSSTIGMCGPLGGGAVITLGA